MATVNWKWLLLTTTSSGSGSHRVARRGPSALSPPTEPNNFGSDTPTSGFWSPSTQATPPAMLHDANGLVYVFAFWAIQGGTTGGVPVGSIVEPVSGNFIVPVGADYNAVAAATAYYVWNFGPAGSGDNGVFIDAFNVNTGFIPDNFVNVTPDGGSLTDPDSLTYKANDGFLDSNVDLTQNETIVAFNPVGQSFLYWFAVTPLTYPTPADGGPTINGNDVSVMPNCVIVAFAVYATAPLPPPLHIHFGGPVQTVVIDFPGGRSVTLPGDGGGGPVVIHVSPSGGESSTYKKMTSK